LKSSKHYKELLLLWANFHSENTYREAVRDIKYLNAMKVLKTRFENGRCPILWSEDPQRKYYSRLYDIIAEWIDPTISLENKFSDPKFDWFKVKIGNTLMSLNQLLEAELIDREFINGIINPLKASIETQLQRIGKEVKFDNDVEGDHDTFISALMQS
jgi:hypothetical protein